MKDDAPPPKHPPRKRYQLEKAPDYWLAVWVNDNELPERERERVQEERDRRKQAQPDCKIGVLVDREDVTPEQLRELKDRLTKAQPTEIHHPWTTRRVAGACRSLGVPVTAHQDMREVVLASTMIIAAPRGSVRPTPATGVWESLLYARHRKLPLTLVLPNGMEGEL